MKSKPLISIIIPSYKNYCFIYETLKSIIFQDYTNIEIIITDDASDDFDKKAIEKYLKTNCKKNIKNFIVHQNKKNLGTVRNLNNAIKLSRGSYITFLAADDTLYDKYVFSRYIDIFNTLSKKELIVVSQVGMYDFKLKKLIEYFISNNNKEKIKKLSPQELFIEMSHRCILPGPGVLYKKEIFKKYNLFDEKYVLVEDYASALKLSRLGVRYNYSDFISVKHRDGGISHGNKIGEAHKSKQYELDIVNILKHEVLPHLRMFKHEEKREFIKKYKNLKWKYAYDFVYKDKDKAQRRKVVKDNLNLIFHGFIKDFIKDFIDQFKGKKFKLLLAGCFIYPIYLITTINLFKISSLILIYISIVSMVFFLAKKYITRLINFISYIV